VALNTSGAIFFDTGARDRVAAIDVVRGIALFGVLVVNLTTEFRVSLFQQFLDTAPAAGAFDAAVERFVSLAFESKAFALFSLLFGIGLAIQFERLAPGGAPFYWLGRRLLALLAFGLVHLLLIWNGDILTEYAIVGLLALPFLLLKTRQLALAALVLIVFYVAQAALPWSIPWPDSATLQQHVALANTVYSTGSLGDILRFGWHELPLLLPLHALALPRTLALFVFGIYLWRIGIFTANRRYKNRIRIAAAGGVLGGWFLSSPTARDWAAHLAPVVLALGYGATIVALMDMPSPRHWLSVFGPAGRMAFTNYLMQSIICGFIFFGYGLGQFGHMPDAAALALAIAIYVAQLFLSSYWLGRYRFGPMEWLWRTLMYGQIQPMAKVAP
jgi:uncharacterized protein